MKSPVGSTAVQRSTTEESGETTGTAMREQQMLRDESLLTEFNASIKSHLEVLHVDMITGRLERKTILALCGSGSGRNLNWVDKLAAYNLRYVRSVTFEIMFYLSLFIWTVAFLYPAGDSKCQLSHKMTKGFPTVSDGFAEQCTALGTNSDCGEQFTSGTCRGRLSEHDDPCALGGDGGITDAKSCRGDAKCVWSQFGCQGPVYTDDTATLNVCQGDDEKAKSEFTSKAACVGAGFNWVLPDPVCACAWRPGPLGELFMPIVSILIVLFLMTPMLLSAFRSRMIFIFQTFEFFYKFLMVLLLCCCIPVTSPWDTLGVVAHVMLVLSFGFLLSTQDALALRFRQEIAFGICGVIWFGVWWLSSSYDGIIEWRRSTLDLKPAFVDIRLDGIMQTFCINLVLFFGRQTVRAIKAPNKASTLQTYIPLDRGFADEDELEKQRDKYKTQRQTKAANDPRVH